ncbi:MAG: two-component system, NtrC family, sensor kinase [Actinomycetota bacterium]|nr:two-component system, NtrC family, sensor kinase [Actinomycetota bacterium]
MHDITGTATPRDSVAENNVHERERLLRSVVDSLDGWLCIVAQDGAILDVSRGWGEHAVALQLDGAASGAGANLLDAFSALPEPLGPTLAGMLLEVIEEGTENRSLKYQMLWTGRSDWFVLRIQPVRHHPSARAVATFVDITQGMRTQEELRRITHEAQTLAAALAEEKTLLAEVLSSIPHLVYWKGPDLRYKGVNSAFLTMRGTKGQEQVLGRTEAELGVDDVLQQILTEVEPRVVATGERTEGLRVDLICPDGEQRTLLLSVLPHLDERSDPGSLRTGVIGVGADVTRVRYLERKLAQANRLESIGQLAAGVAHEINTPMQYVTDNTRFLAEIFDEVTGTLRRTATLLGEEMAELLRADPDSPVNAEVQRVREDLAQIDLDFIVTEVPQALTQTMEGLERVTHIVRAMKDFSHPGQGLVETDINQAIQTTVDISRNEWKYVARLELDLDPQTGIIPCHANEFKQVILNLIVNAAQAIEEKREAGSTAVVGNIRIATRRQEDRVRIEVIDDGPGMSEDTQRRIFDPFFTTKEVGKGTGQGLSLAYATIVQQHRGTLDVVSCPGHGAQFTITIPLDLENEEEEDF